MEGIKLLDWPLPPPYLFAQISTREYYFSESFEEQRNKW